MHAIPRGHRRQTLPNLWRGGLRALAAAILCAYAFGAIGSPPPAQAIDLSDGEMRLSLDTSLSYGLAFRVSGLDESLLGVNSDDGDRNYARGLISNTVKLTSELDLNYRNFGVFARFHGFLDFENRDGERERTPLPDEALDRVGDDVELLDLYLSTAFDIGEMPLDVRLGNQVLNWGESTFIQSGINVINPFDVAKLRKPGAELRDGLLPVPLVSLSAAVAPSLSVEGFYQVAWEETRVDPSGTYFATNDYATPGGSRAFISDPAFADLLKAGGFGPLTPAVNADLAPLNMALRTDCRPEIDCEFLSATRSPDREPRDAGQWGVALRYFAEALNDTEFGFYFVNHHSRLPLVSASFGTLAGYRAGLMAAQAVGAPTSNTVGALALAITPLVRPAVIQAVTQKITEGVIAAVPPGTPQAVIDQQVDARLASMETQQQIANEIQKQVMNQVAEQVGGVAPALAIDRYAQTARYFVEYPEDLQVLGVSFNTLLGASGWALQGEYSFHPDTPLQRTDESVFEEGLAPIIGGLTMAATGQDPSTNPLLTKLGTRLQGYIQRDVSQVQATATRLFGRTLGADTLAFITEVALAFVHDMPDESQTLLQTHGSGDVFADASSWGYRLAGRLDYNNAIGAARLSPYLQFQHDVDGNSPVPSGPFLEDRTALTLGVGVSYLDRLRTDLSYTMYDGKTNYLSDRDFVSVSATYSF